MPTNQTKSRSIDDIWPECFGVLKVGQRFQIWRPHRLLSGHLVPGMVAVVIASEAYFRDGSGWHWRKTRGAKPRVFEVVSFGQIEGDKRRWLIGKYVKKHK